MPPSSSTDEGQGFRALEKTIPGEVKDHVFKKLEAPQAAPRKYEVVYFNLLTFGFAHLSSVYGLYLIFTAAKWQTNVFSKLVLLFLYVGTFKIP